MEQARFDDAVETMATESIKLAEKHAGGSESATICLNDAKANMENGCFGYAISRAVASLRHSVGVFHHDTEIVESGYRLYLEAISKSK